MPMKKSWPTVDDLSDTMRDCLLYWPNGHFSRATKRGLLTRGLVNGKQELTDMGRRARAYLDKQEG